MHISLDSRSARSEARITLRCVELRTVKRPDLGWGIVCIDISPAHCGCTRDGSASFPAMGRCHGTQLKICGTKPITHGFVRMGHMLSSRRSLETQTTHSNGVCQHLDPPGWHTHPYLGPAGWHTRAYLCLSRWRCRLTGTYIMPILSSHAASVMSSSQVEEIQEVPVEGLSSPLFIYGVLTSSY